MKRQRVWKYPLGLTADVQLLEVPVGAKLVRFAMQGDVPTTWWLVWGETDAEARAETTRRGFVIRGTGDPATGLATYQGTADHRGYVWHLFEVLNTAPPEVPVEVLTTPPEPPA